jgi:hypothetical protein
LPDIGPKNQTPQEIAAEALEFVRARKRHQDPELEYLIAHAEGVVAGLESLGALTSPQATVWKRRIAELSAETDDQPVDPVTSAGLSRQEIGPPPPSRFVRLVAGPVEEKPLLDGRVRIVAVELFLDRVRVHWDIAPLPSFATVLGEDRDALDRDTEGLEPERRSLIRDSAFSQRLHYLVQFRISDDVGTEYQFRRGHATGGAHGEERFGSSDFTPAPPKNASEIVVQVRDAKFKVALSNRSAAE